VPLLCGGQPGTAQPGIAQPEGDRKFGACTCRMLRSVRAPNRPLPTYNGGIPGPTPLISRRFPYSCPCIPNYVQPRLLQRRPAAALLSSSGPSSRPGRILPPTATAGVPGRVWTTTIRRTAIWRPTLPAPATASNRLCTTTGAEGRRRRG